MTKVRRGPSTVEEPVSGDFTGPGEGRGTRSGAGGGAARLGHPIGSLA